MSSLTIPVVLRLSAPQTAMRSSFRLYDGKGSEKKIVVMLRTRCWELGHTCEDPRPNLLLDLHITSSIICHLLGFLLSCFSFLPGPFFLFGGPLRTDHGVSDIMCTRFDNSMSLALLLLKLGLGLCRCLHHDGAMGIACINLCLCLGKLLLHLVHC
jgi:hypothetical protein